MCFGLQDMGRGRRRQLPSRSLLWAAGASVWYHVAIVGQKKTVTGREVEKMPTLGLLLNVYQVGSGAAIHQPCKSSVSGCREEPFETLARSPSSALWGRVPRLK